MNEVKIPTVVLVHGAFADSSSWNGVIQTLQESGVPVIAVANPLRGISADAAYLAERMREITGPVIAVGHSYGGAVIGNAAAQTDNVVALVYVAAFIPDVGEVLGDVAATSKDSVLMEAIVPHVLSAPDGGQSGVEFSIDPAKFHATFAADLPEAVSAVMAVTQRPIAEKAFSEPTRGAGWKALPCWAVIAEPDLAAGTDVTRSMAERAGAKVTELAGSHVIMISQPLAVARVILEAVEAAAPVAVGAGRPG